MSYPFISVGVVGDGLGLGLPLGLALGEGLTLGEGLGDELTDGLGDGDGSTAPAEIGKKDVSKRVETIRRNFQLSGLGLLIGLSLTFPLRIEH
jgi:hypothetical protein